MGVINFGILTVSDSSFKGNREDKSGPELIRLVTDDETETGKVLKGKVCCKLIVPDNEDDIREHLISWSDNTKVDVILTTGGTGFSERDVTPEATKAVIDKEASGIILAMLISSLKITPMAMLSRAICGIRNKTLIINLPGSSKAVSECMSVIAPVIPHAVDLIKNNQIEIGDTHTRIQQSTVTDASSHCHREQPLYLKPIPMRFRESPYPMISVEAALDIIYKFSGPYPSMLVDLNEALGRVIACNMYSNYDLPPFRASIKDGYAVLACDGSGKRKVLGGIKAGNTEIALKLTPGTCVRVNTGAPIPDDASAVVQIEDTKLLECTSDNMEEEEIEVTTDVEEGQDIRPKGCDIQSGELVLEAYTKLGPAELGLLASCGYEEVSVVSLPKIGVLSTGDELQCVGKPLMPGRIYDSNKITLLSILKEQGYQAIDMGICPDDQDYMIRKLEQALNKVDVLVTSGSVSMGDRDMLKPILQQHFKAAIHFGRVNMKPGKPTTFATCSFNGKKKYLLCLPGNPVSATVTMHLFVLPLVKRLSGDCTQPVIVKAELTSSYNLDPRPEYARAILKCTSKERIPKAYSTGDQISSKLLSCKNANALLMLPARTPNMSTLFEGDIVNAMLLGFTSI